MSPITHLLGSWLIATATANNRRDRVLVTCAGVIPDADGLGMIADVGRSLITGQENSFHFYQQFHHYLLHGWPGALVVAGILAAFATNRVRVLFLCLLTFHLHLFCDLIGSRGPSIGDFWPIAYSEPLMPKPVFFWKAQWRLDGWQNKIIFVAMFSFELITAPCRGYSIVGIFSPRADAVFVEVLRKWWHSLAPRSRLSRDKVS